MKKYSLLFFLILLLTHCETKKPVDKSTISEFNLINEINEKYVVDTSFLKTYKEIFLESEHENSMIREIYRIYLSNNVLFILDRSLNKVVLFDLNGRYINAIHKIGAGPKEYIGLMDFCIDEKHEQIILLCHQPYKIMWFDYNGEFIKEKSLDELYKQISVDSCYIYCTRSDINNNGKYKNELIMFDFDGNSVKETLEIRDNISISLFPSGNFLTKSGKLSFARRFENLIYIIQDGAISPQYNMNFGKHNFAKELLTKKANDYEFSDICRESGYVYAINNIVDNNKYLTFNTNLGFGLINKDTKELSMSKAIMNAKYGITMDYLPLEGEADSMFAGVIHTRLFIFIKENKDKIGNLKNKNLVELVSKVDDEDNPILVLYNFK